MASSPTRRAHAGPLANVRGRTAGLLVFLALAGAPAHAQCSSNPLPASAPTARLNIVLSDQLFSVANRNDVVGALKLWTEVLSCLTGLNFNVKVEVIGSQAEVRQRVHDNAVDILVLDNADFLELSDAGLVDGIAVGSYRGRPYAVQYLLLVNQPIDSLAQLRGKHAVFYLKTGAAASLAWTATMVAENRLGRADTFFESLESSTKAANCVLPLFFEKIQACVVDARDWETVQEMNPQLGTKLKTLAQSLPVLDGVVALTKGFTAYRERIVASILQMHKDPLGEQILTAMRSGPLLPYRPEYLDSTREFWKQYERTLNPAEQKMWRETRRPKMPLSAQSPMGALGAYSTGSAKE
jgi:ABC-type phosphate/phosphonate transport system substrate-binding protein